MRARDENKEQSIRQKAIEMIAKEGLDGFSMGKLAKAAGVSPATLYIYYKDREDLIIQISTEWSKELFNASLEGFDPEMHFDEGLSIQWKNRADFFLKHPTEMEFIEHIRYTPLYQQISKTLNTHFRDTMKKFVHNAIRRKELVKLPFEVYWSVAFAPLYQLIKFHYQNKSYVNESFQLDDKVMKQALQVVLKALKP